jgi:hypothetical protein
MLNPEDIKNLTGVSTQLITSEVQDECLRQHKKWGEQNHNPLGWLAILGEEFGEVARAACELNVAKNQDPKWKDNYREELVQVAAVAVSAIASYDRNEGAK